MVRSRRFLRWALLILLGLAALGGLLYLGLGGRRTGAQADSCWQAEIANQWTNLDLAGSVLRVSVEGKVGLPVVVRSEGSFYAVGYTGTKPEYGPYVAEFAALSKGTYFVEPEGLDITFEVWLDGQGYTRVEFRPRTCAPTPTPTPIPATATARPQPTATRQAAAPPTPLPAPTQAPPPAAGWQGRVAQHLTGLEGSYWSTIAVRVIGRPAGQEVEIRSDGWTETCKTGTKPEHGPDACEFGALHAGTYRLSPKDLGTHLDVMVGLHEFVLVEFYYTGPPPQTRWVGSVVENTSGGEPTEYVNSAIAVIVSGRPWHEVEIRSNGWTSTCETGHKPEYGPDACEFGGLRAASYTITPKDLGTSVQVAVDGEGWAKVRFDEVVVPAPQPPAPPANPTAAPPKPTATSTATPKPTDTPVPGATITPLPSPTAAGSGWQGWVISNTSGDREGTGVWSVIVVRVLNYGGVAVDLRSGGNLIDTCVTGSKPEYGPDACEFGGLWPSIYVLKPQGADMELELEMDGLGTAEVHFAHP